MERLTRPSRPRERHVNALAHGLAGRIATPRERAMLVGRELERDNDIAEPAGPRPVGLDARHPVARGLANHDRAILHLVLNVGRGAIGA